MHSINFSSVIGQYNIVKELQNLISVPVTSVLFRGGSGCGKTYLAQIFMSQRGDWDYQIASNNIQYIEGINNHVIDEVHLLTNPEILYPKMNTDSFAFCTTEFANLPEPLVNRCITFTLKPYTFQELFIIIRSKYPRLSNDTISLIAQISRDTPRIALQLAFRITQNCREGKLEEIKQFLTDIGIHDYGYTDLDLDYLRVLGRMEKASLKTLSSVLNTDENTLKNIIEPFLLRQGKIQITSGGRKLL